MQEYGLTGQTPFPYVWVGGVWSNLHHLCIVTIAGVWTTPFSILFSDYGMGMNLGIIRVVDNVETQPLKKKAILWVQLWLHKVYTI